MGIILEDEMRIKNSDYRNKVALCLKTWRWQCNYSIRKTSLFLGISEATVKRALEYSQLFINHSKRKRKIRKHNLIKGWMAEKNSGFRDNVALTLRVWRKYYSLQETAKELNVSRSMVGRTLSYSGAYKNRVTYASSDYVYALRWAKKDLAIELLGGKCVKCGNSNRLTLDFHHKGADKEVEIGRLLTGGCEWNLIKKEVLKCDLLCRNCHQEEHTDTERYKRLNLLIQRRKKQVPIATVYKRNKKKVKALKDYR